jgi:hypothetical protein
LQQEGMQMLIAFDQNQPLFRHAGVEQGAGDGARAGPKLDHVFAVAQKRFPRHAARESGSTGRDGPHRKGMGKPAAQKQRQFALPGRRRRRGGGITGNRIFQHGGEFTVLSLSR